MTAHIRHLASARTKEKDKYVTNDCHYISLSFLGIDKFLYLGSWIHLLATAAYHRLCCNCLPGRRGAPGTVAPPHPLNESRGSPTIQRSKSWRLLRTSGFPRFNPQNSSVQQFPGSEGHRKREKAIALMVLPSSPPWLAGTLNCTHCLPQAERPVPTAPDLRLLP